MAQAMASKIFMEKSSKENANDGNICYVVSAGVAAMNGETASDNAITIMQEREIELAEHRARLVTTEIMEEADLILAMTVGHKAALQRNFPNKEIHTLGEYVGSTISVADPYGGDLAIYRQCANEIYDLLIKLAERIFNKDNKNNKN